MTDHARDFDFLVGKWRVKHRQLKDRLAGSEDWIEFGGTSELWATLNGHGNVDDNYLDNPGGPYRAMTVRTYNPDSKNWAIWWVDARNPHRIDPPVFGNFRDNVGTFEGDDIFDGRPIRVRFTWTRVSANSARWEQAFSPDGGKSWETNWQMEFERAA